MIFKSRLEAGKRLAEALKAYNNSSDAIVIGLPRGGVVLAAEIAKELNIPLDIICARKIGAPYNPEFGIGAISESGGLFLDNDTIENLDIDPEYIQNEIKSQKKESARRANLYRGERLPLNLKNKIVILVDDGIATGATMKASIQTAKQLNAKKIIVAVPVAPPDTLTEIKELTDEVVCLSAPSFFMAVGQFYEQFEQTTDDEVIQLMKKK